MDIAQELHDQVGQELTAVPELDPAAELVIYRVAQEALTNVARHSGSSHAPHREGRAAA